MIAEAGKNIKGSIAIMVPPESRTATNPAKAKWLMIHIFFLMLITFSPASAINLESDMIIQTTNKPSIINSRGPGLSMTKLKLLIIF